MQFLTLNKVAAAGVLLWVSSTSAIPMCAVNCFTQVITDHPPLSCTLPSMYDCFCAIPELQNYFVQCVRGPECPNPAATGEAIQFGVDLCLELGYTITVPPVEPATTTTAAGEDSTTAPVEPTDTITATETLSTDESSETETETGEESTAEATSDAETTTDGGETNGPTATATATDDESSGVTGAPTATDDDDEQVTSTIYDTETYTVTSCPPEVTKCPVGQVTTKVVPITTTVCPVTEKFTISTVYTTKVTTITSCPPAAGGCTVGHETTTTIPVSTTVCPVTEGKPSTVPEVPTKHVEYPCPGGCNSTSTFTSVPNPPTKPSGHEEVPPTTPVPASMGTINGVSALLSLAALVGAYNLV